MDPTTETPELDINAASDQIADELNLLPPGSEAPDSPAAAPLPGDTSAAAAPSETPAGLPVEAKPAEPAKPAEGAPADTPAPKSWRKESAALWNTVPPLVREEVAKREHDIIEYVEHVKAPVAIGKQFEKIAGPYMEMFAQSGINIFQNYEATLQVQRILTRGSPQEKMEVIQSLAKSCGLEIDGTELTAPAARQQQYVAQLEARLAKLEGGVQSVATTVNEARSAELAQGILQFAQDANHPYFEELSDDITGLIEGGLATTLDEAYQLAVARSPVHRQKVVETETTKRLVSIDAENAARAEAARKAAGANVRSSGSRRVEPPAADIDATLKNTLANIRARES